MLPFKRRNGAGSTTGPDDHNFSSQLDAISGGLERSKSGTGRCRPVVARRCSTDDRLVRQGRRTGRCPVVRWTWQNRSSELTAPRCRTLDGPHPRKCSHRQYFLKRFACLGRSASHLRSWSKCRCSLVRDHLMNVSAGWEVSRRFSHCSLVVICVERSHPISN